MSASPRPWSAAARKPAARRSASRSADDKPAPLAVGVHPADLDVGDARGGRTAPGPGDQRLDGLGLALDLGLDGAVGPVAHPAGDTEPLGLVLHRAAVPDALHAPADHELRARRHQSPRSFTNAFSSRVRTPSAFAFATFEPGSAPTTT